MKFATSQAIANLITDEELSTEYVIPSPFDPRVAETVAKAISDLVKK